MASRKSELYNELKSQGWVPDKHYRDYNVEELQSIAVTVQPTMQADRPPAAPQPPEGGPLPELDDPPPAEFFGMEPPAPIRSADPDEMAGERQNTKAADEVIRVDEQGRQWLQEEVRKPAYPKPRGRRVLTYMDTGVETQTTRVGEYVETFEVAGKGAPKASEIKITLPSYQVGIYKDPRFPFKVYTYNGRDGFDLFEVEEFYGGREMVPPVCKRIYIENVLCYDMRTVIRAIQEEYRHNQLIGRIK